MRPAGAQGYRCARGSSFSPLPPRLVRVLHNPAKRPSLCEVVPRFPPPGAYGSDLPSGPAGLQGVAPTLAVIFLVPPSLQHLWGILQAPGRQARSGRHRLVSKPLISKVTLFKEADSLQPPPK